MKVLLIAYYYPPIASGGTERALKMMTYLCRFGHEPFVLTQTYGRTAQSSNPSEIRVYDPSHNTHRSGVYKGIWFGLRLYTEFLNQLGIPHSIYSWWKQAVLNQADSVMASVMPDVILATYPPVEDFEIGLFLAQHFHLPLIADFRDGLLFEPIETRFERYPCLAAHYTKIEQTVAKQASAVITAFPALSKYFSEYYGCSNVVTMTNGWDAGDFEQLPTPPPFEPAKFHLVHTGSIGGSYSGRDIRPFLDALRHLITYFPRVSLLLRVHFVGVLQARELSAMSDLRRQGIILYHGAVPRKMALAFQKQADLLLLVTSSVRKGAAPGKLFEYLYARKPILALSPDDGYTQEILDRTGAGWNVAADDVTNIARLLSRVVTDQAFSTLLNRSEEEISVFSRETQMRKLHDVLMTLEHGSRIS